MTPIPVCTVDEYLRDELEARDWSINLFAAILQMPIDHVHAVCHGEKRLTVSTAVRIGQAFGTGPEIWLNLQARGEVTDGD